jgi:cytochrome P450/NADPH-cytochrome P450 reductase
MLGLASSFLAKLAPGDKLEALVRPGKDRFKPPKTPRSVPMIMVCAGAGIAPFRAFVEHRAEIIRHDPSISQTLAPALLYVGCRNIQEALYVDELTKWEEAGAVKVRWVYSRPICDGAEVLQGSKYVQDQVWADKDEVVALWDKGARIYVCGSRELSQGMKGVAKRIYEDVARSRCGPKDEQAIDAWWLGIIRERYAVDVF